MATYVDQAITKNLTRGDFGYDIVQWLPWRDDEECYCSQFILHGEQYFGASRVPYKDWVKRSTHHNGSDGLYVKVLGKLAGVPLHGKGPVQIDMQTNDRFIVKVVGAAVEAFYVATTVPRQRKVVTVRDRRQNAMK